MHVVDQHGWTILEGDNGFGLAESMRISTVAQKPVEKFVKQKKCAIEIGVYYGFTTRWLSSVFETVYTFDLDNAIFKCFQINMKNFNCSNVIAHNHGIGACEETIDYPYSLDTPTYMNMGNMKRFTNSKQKLKALDNCGIEEVNFIIIDTDGYGKNVIEGAFNTISKNKPVIVCKLEDNATPILEKELGYKQVQQVSKNDLLYIHRDQIS